MKNSLLFIFLILLSGACTKQSLETAYHNQESKIDKYITSLISDTITYKGIDSTCVHRNGGSNRVSLERGEGEELQDGAVVSFRYAAYVFTGGKPSSSNLFSTNVEELAVAAGWNSNNLDLNVKTMDLGEEDLITGLHNGLVGVQGGEHCVILFSGKYGFGNKKVGTIPANSALLYEIWVESISND